MKLLNIIEIIVAISVFVASFLYTDQLIVLIKSQFPAGLITKSPSGGIFLYLNMAFLIALIALFPMIIFEIIRYVRPALYEDEKKYLSKFLKLGLLITLLFFIGVLFGALMIFEIILPFFIEFNKSIGVTNIWNATSTINFILLTCLYSGFIFQTPLIVYYLLSWNILKLKHISYIRKFIIIGALIISAIITPPDLISQFIFALPIWALFEISVLVWRYRNVGNH